MMRVLCILMFVISMTAAALSAEISVEGQEKVKEYGDKCLVTRIILTGEIRTGDVVKLKQAYATAQFAADAVDSICYVNEDSAKTLVYLDLNSNGGSYLEALSILEWMGNDGRTVSTYVGENSACYSACATILLGGSVVGADGSIFLRRVMHPKAKVGFHAPFPDLEDRKYSADEVMGYFHTAFLIEHDFFARAKKLGLSAEVAQYLMRPTNDDFFMIDNVGNALLVKIDVQSKFSFSSSFGKKYKVDNNTALNICANNQIIANNGDTSELMKFFDYVKESKIELSVVPIMTRDEQFRFYNALAYVIPIEYSGEGMYRSCIVTIQTDKFDGDLPERSQPTCWGAYDDAADIPTKLKNVGLTVIPGRDSSFCRLYSPLAGQHFTRKLSDLTPAELGE